MGINVELFKRHPLQIDAVNIVEMEDGTLGHIFVRDRKQVTRLNRKDGAWHRFKLKPGSSYLIIARLTWAGDKQTNYVVEGAREVTRHEAAFLNRELYEHLLLRDQAGATHLDDPLWREAEDWIMGSTGGRQKLRDRHRTEHEHLLGVLSQTGNYSPRLRFVARWSLSWQDLLDEAQAITPAKEQK